MATAGGARVRRLFDRAASADSLAEVMFTGIGAILLSVGTAIASGILTVADVFIVPVSMLTEEIGGLIGSVFGGAARIIDFGALATALSIGPGGRFNLGPLSFALAIASILLALWIVAAYRAEEATSNFFPGLPFDVPTPGFTDSEEEKD